MAHMQTGMILVNTFILISWEAVGKAPSVRPPEAGKPLTDYPHPSGVRLDKTGMDIFQQPPIKLVFLPAPRIVHFREMVIVGKIMAL